MQRCVATWDTLQPEVQEQHEVDLYALVAAFCCWCSIISAYCTQNCYIILLYSCSCAGDESFSLTFIQTLCFFKPSNKLVLEPNSFPLTHPHQVPLRSYWLKAPLEVEEPLREVCFGAAESSPHWNPDFYGKQWKFHKESHVQYTARCLKELLQRIPRVSSRILADLYLKNISAKQHTFWFSRVGLKTSFTVYLTL